MAATSLDAAFDEALQRLEFPQVADWELCAKGHGACTTEGETQREGHAQREGWEMERTAAVSADSGFRMRSDAHADPTDLPRCGTRTRPWPSESARI